MRYRLNSLKGVYIGDHIGFRVWGLNSLKGAYIGEYYRAYKGDTRSLDYSAYEH